MSALVIGEALVDVVVTADSTIEHPGGSPANVALGLARLGRSVELATRLGDDDRGRVVADHLAASGVRLTPGTRAARTSVATAHLDATGAATYGFEIDWDLARVEPTSPPRVVHAGSIGAVLAPGAQVVAAAVADLRGRATITYDPNVRPTLMPPAGQTRPIIERLVALADVVKASDEDLAWLAPGVDPLDLLRDWSGRGPAVVVMTRGGQGAVALTADGRRVDVAAPPVDVVDTVGAGDAFMAGLIDGLWEADLLGAARRDALATVSDVTLTATLRRGAQIAAITVSRPGADPPTTAELPCHP